MDHKPKCKTKHCKTFRRQHWRKSCELSLGKDITPKAINLKKSLSDWFSLLWITSQKYKEMNHYCIQQDEWVSKWLCWLKKDKQKEYIPCNFTYKYSIKSKLIYSNEKQMSSCLGERMGVGREEQKETGDYECVLYLSCGDSFMGICIYLTNGTLLICIAYYLSIISQ